MVRGYYSMREEWWDMAAWIVSHLMAAWVGRKAPTPAKLLKSRQAFRQSLRVSRRPDGPMPSGED
jgi:hypothetical protein